MLHATRFATRGFTPSLENGLAPSGVPVKKNRPPANKLPNFFLNSPRREATKPFFSAGFTIAEIVVVIAIISLLSSVILFNASKSRSLARDGQRVSDLTTIQNALNLYFADNKTYPSTISGSVLSTYLKQVPRDPKTGAVYKYSAIYNNNPSGCKSYHLGATMENIGHIGLSQDKDNPVSLSSDLCGSTSDFKGVSTACNNSSPSIANDLCFDLSP